MPGPGNGRPPDRKAGNSVSVRFRRFAIGWLLLLTTIWVLDPYLMGWWFSASTPRTVTARGNLGANEQTTIDLFKKASPSVVHVFARGAPTASLFSGGQQSLVQSGSGIIWDSAGHVITNNHVITGTAQIGIRLTSGEFVAGRVVGTAPNYDLALLQLERPSSALHPITVGRSADLQVGQSTFAIGNPYGLDQTLTHGIISALGRRLPTDTAHEIKGMIQTDAPINPGNSGGPLLDSAGRLIGVNSAIVSGSGASAGIGFAIPVDIVNRVATELIRNGHVPLPGIGIVAARQAEATSLGIDGVVIVRTVPDSPAASAGIQGVDADGTIRDVITEVNGKPIHSMDELASTFENAGIGKEVTLTVQRDGRSRNVKLRIADISQLNQG
ncbi:MAG: trypsin-like peptidase domain-containing protein [Bradyrhizobium sp.]|uniref:S1C family serine protease n=1 Tax=Bradyrhizobium sp. TaxID=376 RepID=UPI001C28D980|nr:trypsin-like peptidase domain-containing protein [Bradyrhizobium sp.]MBU6462590.1 trypsin-like peptidase domain-containing protein [Pseudomonadota bacterium]MDE2067211.1 trypsin-like peptidase domain-containing protein [Bradyrhizobium sp.]MDE2470545.1 trypsin-like peptidase domain-containing protein [Bradyrhizobium sp.]